MNAIKATGSAGKHVSGHTHSDVEVTITRTRRGNTYHDVDVWITRTRRGNWNVEIIETWGSAQGGYEEHGRKQVIGRGKDLSEAISDARTRAKNAGIQPDYIDQAIDEAEQEAYEELEASENDTLSELSTEALRTELAQRAL